MEPLADLAARFEALCRDDLDPDRVRATARQALARRVLARLDRDDPVRELIAGEWRVGWTPAALPGAPDAPADTVVLAGDGDRVAVLVGRARVGTLDAGVLTDLQNEERLLLAASWAGHLQGLHARAVRRVAEDARLRTTQRHRIALADLEIAATVARCMVRGLPPATPGVVSADIAAARWLVASLAQDGLRLAAPLLPTDASVPTLALAATRIATDCGGDELALAVAGAAVIAAPTPEPLFSEIARHAAETDATGRVTDASWAALRASGYLRAFHAPQDGGLGLPEAEVLRWMEDLGGACASTGWKATISSNLCGRVLARHGSPAHRTRWLEPVLSGERLACIAIVESVGSDFSSVRTTARRRPGGWIVDGAKATVTNAPAADVCLLFTLLEDGGAGLFVVDMRQPGVSTEAYAKAGIRGLPWGPVRLEGVEVADADVLLAGPRDEVTAAVIGFVDWGLLYQSACGVGIAEAALRATLAFQRGRPAHGGAMIELGHVYGRLAEMRARIDAGHRLTAEALRAKTAGEPTAGRLCRLAKIYTSEMAVQVALEAVRLHGSAGVRPEWPAERLLRDALPSFYAGMSSDVLRDLLVAPQVGADPFARPDLGWLAERGY